MWNDAPLLSIWDFGIWDLIVWFGHGFIFQQVECWFFQSFKASLRFRMMKNVIYMYLIATYICISIFLIAIRKAYRD